ncbi:hypothetical protein C8J57DRAFT_1717344 [Mycena rebaudengoi]|nr:hypothetical protein C8J57DRAFT_1717344 [Mycena rebaudengoi]
MRAKVTRRRALPQLTKTVTLESHFQQQLWAGFILRIWRKTFCIVSCVSVMFTRSSPWPSLAFFKGELWNIATAAVIWSLLDNPRERHYTIELLDYETTAIFLDTDVSPTVMRLIVIDLKTRDSTQLLEMGLPVAFGVFDPRQLTVVVLKRELLDHSLPIHIAARHIFLLVHSTSQVQHLRIFAISVQELAGLWQHISSISLQDAIEVGDVPATVADELPFSDPLCLKMAVYKSPLHADGYKLTVHYVDLPALAVTLPAGSAKRYLRHSEGKVRTSAWELTSGVQGFPLPLCHQISYAGYVDNYRRGVILHLANVRLHDPRTGAERTIEDNDILVDRSMLLNRSLSPYSHALATIRGSSYVVSYYL